RTARLALYRPSGGPLSLEPRAPFSCRPGQSRREPPRALRSRVLWSASSWPSCFGRLSLFSPAVVSAGDDPLLRTGGRAMISRRRFTTGVVIALTPLGATASAQEYKAQQAGRKVPRVGFLLPGGSSAPISLRLTEAFRQGLRDHGYAEGEN